MGISVFDLPPGATIFEWKPDDGSRVFFAIDPMIQWASDHLDEIHICRSEVFPHVAKFLWDDGSIDQWKLDLITEDSFNVPIFYCEDTEGKHVLVDGRHRYVYAVDKGMKYVPTVILMPGQWEQFIIDTDPSVLMVLI
jgi:hypothetical protein